MNTNYIIELKRMAIERAYVEAIARIEAIKEMTTDKKQLEDIEETIHEWRVEINKLYGR